MLEPSPWVIEGTEQNFEQEVLARSKDLPVIVDFWATWCGPCQELGPILEKLANEAAGQFLLVKVDVDREPGIAGAFQVRSIPHVFALRHGQLVDQFMGAIPEEQIREWLERFQPSPVEQLLLDARKLLSENASEAEAKYREALELAPQDDQIRIELARFLLSQHRNAECHAIIDQLAARGFLEPEAEHIKAELEVRESAAESGGVAECRAAVTANPGDPALQLKLAEALGAAQQYEEALKLCLEMVKQNSGPIREETRSTMVKLFQMLGPDAELTRTYRRQLATALY